MTVVGWAAAIAAAVAAAAAGFLLGARAGQAALRGSERRAGGTAPASAPDPAVASAERFLALLERRSQVERSVGRIDDRLIFSRDIAGLLEQFAGVANCLTVLLSDDQGWPLAANAGGRNIDKLGATASMAMLIAAHVARDGSPPPNLLCLRDASSVATLCRIFHVGRRKMALTIISPEALVTPHAIDLLLDKITMLLTNRETAPDAAAPGTAGGMPERVPDGHSATAAETASSRC